MYRKYAPLMGSIRPKFGSEYKGEDPDRETERVYTHKVTHCIAMGFGTLRPALGREVIWAGADRYSDSEGACETNGEKAHGHVLPVPVTVLPVRNALSVLCLVLKFKVCRVFCCTYGLSCCIFAVSDCYVYCVCKNISDNVKK